MSVNLIKEKSVGTSWINALLTTIVKGHRLTTEYDKEKTLPSFDISGLICIKDAFSYPLERKNKIIKIQSKKSKKKYEIYGSIADTYLVGSIQSGYIEEIINGINDHYIIESDTSYPYSYHDRLFNYSAYSKEDVDKIRHPCYDDDGNNIILHKCKYHLPRVNQIDYIVEKLKESPYSRRAQAITWRPYADPYSDDPPCLQRIWCRIIDQELVMQTMWRSRDLFKAWEANVNGMLYLQKRIAEKLQINTGDYIDFSNSLHIYGNDLEELLDILKRIKKRKEVPTHLTQKFKNSMQIIKSSL